MIHYSACPICGSNNISEKLTAKDYTVSHEVFTILECADCTARFTQDVAEANEIGKYYQSSNYISHSDTNEGLVNKLYHVVRKRTLKSKQQLVEKFTGIKKGQLLDIGAGTGAFVKTMQEADWEVTGLEPDEAARKIALTQHSVLLQALEELHSLSENSYDAISMWHVLEHVHTLHEYIEIFQKILKKDGALIIAVPNYTSADATHYKEHWAAYDVPRHLYHFSPKSMQVLMAQHGFQVAKMLPMWYDSSYVSMLSETYKTSKSRLPSALWQGLKSNLNALGKSQNCSSVIYVCKKQS